MAEGERFNWAKFFSGFVNPLNFAKSIVMLFQVGIFLIIVLSIVFTGFWLKNKLLKPPRPASAWNIGAISGGTVHNSSDEVRKKYGVNIF